MDVGRRQQVLHERGKRPHEVTCLPSRHVHSRASTRCILQEQRQQWKNYAPKSLAKDVGVAFECHVNTIAAQHKLPPARITKKEQCVVLYSKYLRGFSTYKKINMQLSRVACRFAISRLGLDPSTGMWCTDTDAIRSVTISEYSTTIISPSSLSAPDRKNILLSGMLLEWLEAHGYKVEADPKEIDYNKWSDLNAKNYIAHLKPKLEIQKGKTTSSRSRYSLSAACIQDTNAQEIPTDKPHHSTHYLVENRKPRIAALKRIIIFNAKLERKYARNTNDYTRLNPNGMYSSGISRVPQVKILSTHC